MEAQDMGDVLVNQSDAPPVESAEEMVGQFQAELLTALPEWKKRLAENPSELGELEHEVHAAFARGADLLIAGLLAIVMKQATFDEGCEQTRRSHGYPLRRGRMRQLQIRLLGGLLIWINSLYCEPRRSGQWKAPPSAVGLYVELTQFGFGKACSPALESWVTRQAALCPSLEFAVEELTRQGVRMNIKTVRRISLRCGSGLLALRKHELTAWREGKLAAGSELKGKRVTVQIDGGRTKIRQAMREAPRCAEETNEEGLVVENAPGRSKKRPRRTYPADWREPRLMTIFVHDEHGRMEKNTRATIDGTFLGPDAISELIAMHLHRLGASEAASITFVADGARWIWDRIPTIVEAAGLNAVPIHEVLDCCHAAHHISLALASLGLSDKERMPLYRHYRTLLRNGQWRRVVEELSELSQLHPDNDKLLTEIAYLEKHGEAGHLKYPKFRQQGLPLGSGAIESSIRRVINLRLKGNGMFWLEESAEAMLQIRAQILTGRWDARLQEMRRLLAHDGRLDWSWEPRPMSIKNERAAENVN